MRSPVRGYNHNVVFQGKTYHVQTEDSGPARPHITTHAFLEGTILGSLRQEYDATLSEDLVKQRMQLQHKTMMKHAAHGMLTAEGSLHTPHHSPKPSMMSLVHQARFEHATAEGIRWYGSEENALFVQP